MNTSRHPRNGAATVFDRACAVLCLLLLLFSVGHTVLGHGALSNPSDLFNTQPAASHHVSEVTSDSPDTCALCVVMATAVHLHVFSVDVPQAACPRQPEAVAFEGPVPGWHAALACRPPPTA